MPTTIQIEPELKSKLDSFKIHHRETYNELLSRLIENFSPEEEKNESLVETIEILSDSKTMRDLANSLQELEKGNLGKSLEDIERELGV